MSIRCIFVAALALVVTTALAISASARVPSPTIEGPIASPEGAFILWPDRNDDAARAG